MKSGSIEREDRELTVEEAADVLRVSVAYVVGLLDRGELSCRDVEAQGRIKGFDLLAYEQRDAAERHKVVDELTAEAEKHRLGY